jgi:hypothetical protein
MEPATVLLMAYLVAKVVRLGIVVDIERAIVGTAAGLVELIVNINPEEKKAKQTSLRQAYRKYSV